MTNGMTRKLFTLAMVFLTIIAESRLQAEQKPPTPPQPPLPVALEPCLQNPTETGITVCFYARGANKVRVVWATDGVTTLKETRAQAAAIPGTPWATWKVRLNGLHPNTCYQYQVRYQPEGQAETTTDIHHFTTLATNGTFRAAVFNDLHNNLKTLNALMKHVQPGDYDVVFLLGDVLADPTYSPTNDSILRTLQGYIQAMRASDKPLIMVRGNHETRGNFASRLAYLFDLPDLTATESPADQRWNFTLHTGPAWFVALDTGEDDDFSTPESSYKKPLFWQAYRQRQTPWLQDLVKHQDAGAAPWHIFLSHIPLYNNNPWISAPSKLYWEGALKDAGVDLELAGHDHGWKYLPKEKPNSFTIKDGNASKTQSTTPPWDVVIGGGPSINEGTVGLLTADDHKLQFRVLAAKDGRTLTECILTKH